MDKRLKVLFFPPPQHQKEPWERDIVEAIEPRHDLVYFDRSLPLDRQFKGIDAVIDFGGSNARAEMADLASAVKLWQVQANGYDSFPLDHWRQKGIPVANCPGQFSAVGLAESAMVLMLMLARRWHDSQSNLQQRVLYTPMGIELCNRRLGLIGFGASARELAIRARAFGMKVSAADVRKISPEDKERFGLEAAVPAEKMDTLIQESDFLSLHPSLNKETYHLMNTRRIQLMKPSAFLINIARGALVDQNALLVALTEKRLGGAGLDVVESEPIDPEHPLLKMPNVLVMPHIAGSTCETSRRRAGCAAENIDRVARGLEPLHRIDLVSGPQLEPAGMSRA